MERFKIRIKNNYLFLNWSDNNYVTTSQFLRVTLKIQEFPGHGFKYLFLQKATSISMLL